MPKVPTPEEASTRETYNKHAQDYLRGWHRQKPGFLGKKATRLSKFRELLPTGSILEIGCGGGYDARWFVDNGYDYIGVDFSSGMLEQARGDNPDIRFDQTSVYDSDFDEPFDGFWCSAVLLHIPKSRIDEALAAIHKSVKRGAYGLISIKEGVGEAVEGDGRFHAYWSDDDFSKCLNENSYRVIKRAGALTNGIKWLTYIVQTEGDRNDNKERH